METPRDGRYVYRGGNVSKSDIRAVDGKVDALSEKVSTVAKSTSTANWTRGALGASFAFFGLLLGWTLVQIGNARDDAEEVKDSTEKSLRVMDEKRVNPLESELDKHVARSDALVDQLRLDVASLKEDLSDAEEEIRRLQRYHGFKPVVMETE